MTINEIALALTAYLLLKWGNRVAESDDINSIVAIVVLLTNIPAFVYLLYFMGRSVLCYFGE